MRYEAPELTRVRLTVHFLFLYYSTYCVGILWITLFMNPSFTQPFLDSVYNYTFKAT